MTPFWETIYWTGSLIGLGGFLLTTSQRRGLRGTGFFLSVIGVIFLETWAFKMGYTALNLLWAAIGIASVFGTVNNWKRQNEITAGSSST